MASKPATCLVPNVTASTHGRLNDTIAVVRIGRAVSSDNAVMSEALAFGEIVRSLRGSLDQVAFGLRHGGYRRQTISAIENGTRMPTRRLLEALVTGFPDSRERLEASFAALQDATERKPIEAIPSAGTVEQIRSLLKAGLTNDARREIAELHNSTSDPKLRITALELMYETGEDQVLLFETGAQARGYSRRGNFKRVSGLQDYVAAGLRHGEQSGAAREAAELRCKLARRIFEHHQPGEALAVLDESIAMRPECAPLWIERAKIRRSQGLFVDAHACLNIAFSLGGSRPKILAQRGQVLVDLGRYAEGIAEIGEALPTVKHPLERGKLMASRGYAEIRSDPDPDRGFATFDEAHALPVSNNPWIRYFEALSHRYLGNIESVFSALRLALRHADQRRALTTSQVWTVVEICDEFRYKTDRINLLCVLGQIARLYQVHVMTRPDGFDTLYDYIVAHPWSELIAKQALIGDPSGDAPRNIQIERVEWLYRAKK